MPTKRLTFRKVESMTDYELLVITLMIMGLIVQISDNHRK